MTRRKFDHYYQEKKESPPMSFPDKRLCPRCKQMKKRSSGKWLGKKIWICHDCNKTERG